jgi:phenylalanyl-tRNA synthetase beta chain
MAVLVFEKAALEHLVGRKLTEQDYNERIPLFGCPLEKMEKDKVAYEVSPNRPDILSMEGFARAIRNFTSQSPKLSDFKVSKGPVKITVEPSVKDVRPFITCAVIRKVRMTDDLVASLMQVQEKLHDTLGRKRKKVAIGVHDISRVTAPFTYKAAAPDEISFIPLDTEEKMTMGAILKRHPKGTAYAHILEGKKKYPVIVDKKGQVLSFPPIINGELTRVTNRTTDIFIDVTGTDERAINQALNVIVTSFSERGCVIEGVTIVSGAKKTITPNLDPWKMKVDPAYVRKVLGLDVDKAGMGKILRKMDIGYDGKHATIPAYRADVMHPMDIAEDVAIAYGYERIEPVVPPVATIAQPLQKYDHLYLVKQMMIGQGFQEVINLTLTNVEDEFDKMCMPRLPVAETLNAVTPECNVLRRDILPSLMDIFSNNQHYEYPQRIFEAGDVIILDQSAETGARNLKKLGCAVADTKVSYGDISSVLDGFLSNMGVKYELRPQEIPCYIDGRAAEIVVDGKVVGSIGEVAPKVLNNWHVEMPVAAFELDLEMLI